MNRGTLFLLIILFSQVVFAQSEQFAQYSRQLQQVSCPFRNPALSGLKDLRNISKEQCKELLQSKQCKDLFDKIRANGEKPEEKGLKCNDPQSLVTKLQDDWNYNLGCAIGGWNFVKDTFVVAGIQLGEFAGKVAENNRAIEDASKKDQAENVICDKDPQYKKNLYTLYNSNVPKLLKVTPPTDAIIGQTSCEAIKAQLKKARLEKSKYAGDLLQAKIMARNPNLTADEKEFRDWNTNPQPLKINNVDLIAMAERERN